MRHGAPWQPATDPMYLYSIIYMGKITWRIYWFYLYDLEMLYTPDTMLIALEDPLENLPFEEPLVRD